MIRLAGQAGTNGSLTKAAAMAALLGLAAEDALLDGLECRLYTDGPTPNIAMLWTDFTEADASWYAAITPLTWDSPAYQDGAAEMVSVDPPVIFNYSGTDPSQSIKGFALTKTDGPTTTVFYAEDLAAPKVMSQIGDKLVIFPTVQLSPAV